MRDSSRVLAALVAGLVFGAAIAWSGNATLLGLTDWIAPIGTLWVGAIRMTVIPLVISLVIVAVVAAADVKAVGRIGGRTLLVFVSLLAGMALVVIPIATRIFALLPRDPSIRPPLPPGAAEAAGQVAATQAPTFVQWLTSLLPANPIGAAAEGAMVPLIIFTLLFALAIAQSPADARDILLRFFRGIADAMLVLVRWVIWLAPLGVFAVVLPLAARTGLALVSGVGFYIVVYALSCVVATLLLYPVIPLLTGISIGRFAKGALPAQLIGFSSSSSIATLPAMVEGSERTLALPSQVTGFVLPLAVSMFKLAAPVSWTVGALFVAWFYGVELHAQQLITIGLASVFLGFAAPGVPRGAFLMLAPLFVAVGLPAEGIGILIAVDPIPDMFATIVNVTGDMTAAALVSGKKTGSTG